MKKTTLKLTSGILLSSLFLGNVSVVDIAKAEDNNNKTTFESDNKNSNKNIATKVTSENGKNYLVLTATTDVKNINLTVKLGDQEKKFKHDEIKAGETIKFEIVLPENKTSENATSNRVVNPAKTDATLLSGTDLARESLTTEVLVEGLKITTTVSYDVDATKVSVQTVNTPATTEATTTASKVETSEVVSPEVVAPVVEAPVVTAVPTNYPTVAPLPEATLPTVSPVVPVMAKGTSLVQAAKPVVNLSEVSSVTTAAPKAETTTVAPATTKAPVVTTQAAPKVETTTVAPATTTAAVVTTQAAPKVETTTVAPATTKAPVATTQAAPVTTAAPKVETTTVAPVTTKAPVATTQAAPKTTAAPKAETTTKAVPATTKAPVVTTQAAPKTTAAPKAETTTKAAPATTKAPVVTTQAAPKTTAAPKVETTTKAAPATTAAPKATKVMPFASSNYTVTSPYGVARNISSIGVRDVHNGVDFVTGNNKESILSTEAGTVVGAGVSPYGDGAQYVTIKHSDKSYTSYWHLANNSITVKAGQKVEAGQKIGTIGSTGWSTGVHLHFMHATSSNIFNSHQDPMKYLSNAAKNQAVGAAGPNVVKTTPATTKAATAKKATATTTKAATAKKATATTTKAATVKKTTK